MFRTPILITSAFVASVAILVFACCSFFSATPSALASASPSKASGANSAPECGLNWNVVTSPNVDGRGELYGVDALSDSDVWAVGSSQGTITTTLIEHWDGSAWSVIPSPNAGTGNNYLKDVEAIASNNVWAVGYHEDSIEQTLIEHWNGTAWSIVPSANKGPGPNVLKSVSAVSPTDIWAVGYFSSDTSDGALIEHWNGASWALIRSADVFPNEVLLNSVVAISSNDVWVAGLLSSRYPGFLTFYEHWNGTAWSAVAGAGDGSLNDIAAISSTDAWAVGKNGYSTYQPYIEHWDGSRWTNVLVPAPANGDGYLSSVVAISSNNVWAVGTTYYDTSKENHPFDHAASTLVEHWDGTAWGIVSSSNAHSYDELFGVTATSSTGLWAVGDTLNGGFQTLVERYDPVQCTPTATATLAPPRCPGERFTDVCPGDYFYQHVLDLNDLGVVSGYTTAPPCEGTAYIPCFRPGDATTRGQIAKIVSLAAGFSEDVTGQTFADVTPDSTFYQYIERMAARGIITGYPCGGANEPCDLENRPYFRPGTTVTRGQLSKITAASFGFDDEVTGQTFEDVLPASTFYTDVERLAQRDIIAGYPCGSGVEPCGPENRPYFRPSSNVTRGQIAKIVNLARLQIAPTSTVTVTPEVTYTPTAIDTATVTSTPTSIDTSVPTMTATPTPFSTETSTSTATPTP